MKRILLLLLVSTMGLISSAQTVTIPAANTNSNIVRQPLGCYFGYERTELLYTQTEIGQYGTITSVAFYLQSVSSAAASTPVQIRMATTTNTTVTSGTYSTRSAGSTLVFSGNILSSQLTAGSWITITLDSPFSYSTNNLTVFVETNIGGTGGEGSAAKQFRRSTPGADRFQSWNTDNSPPTGNGSPGSTRSNIQLVFQTAPPACTIPSAVTVTPTSATAAQVAWTCTSCTGSFVLEYGTAGFTPGTGASAGAGGTVLTVTSPYSLSGLPITTITDIYVRQNCGGSGFSANSVVKKFLPGDNCTNPIDLSTITSPFASTTVGYTSDISTCRSGSPDRIFYIDVPNQSTLVIGESTNSYDEYEYVGYGPTCPGATPIQCWDNDALAQTTWVNTTGSTQRVWYIQDGYATTTPFSSGTFMLQWSLTAPPLCPAPTALTATGITGNSANLGWTDNAGASAWDIEWGLTGFTQGTGTIINNTATNPHLLGSLSSSTTYQFYVRADCDPGNNNTNVSAWTGPFSFSTLFDCSGLTTITCDSEVTSGNLATTGGTISVATCGFSTPGKEARYSFTSTYAGTYVLQITNVNGGTGYIDYFYKVADGNCGTNTGWTCIDDNSTLGTDNITLAANTTYYILLDAESTSGTANHTFKITCCPQASAATTTAITQNSATLNWTENGGATTWDIEWGPSGFTQGTGTLIDDTSTKPYPLTSLSASTAYQWYVKPSCSTTWLGPISFTTTLTNDQAAGAILLTQQTDCSAPLTGQTSVGATQSLPAILCDGFTGTADDDVWYRFVATGTDAIIEVNTPTDIVLEILAADATTSLLCSDALVAGGESINVTGFTPNDTYYIRVYSYSSGGIPSFSICVHYPECGANSVYLETANGTYDLDQPCDDGNGWTYYSDPNQAGNYMFAIQWDPNNTGANVSAKANAAVSVNVQSMISATNGSISASYGMGRYWNVELLNGASMNGLVNVKFFYNPAEKTATETASANFATTYGVPNNGFSWFKTSGSIFTPADVTAADFQSGVVLLTEDGSGTENGVTYVQFNGVSSFSGGTGATGAGAGFLPVELMAFRGKVMDAGNKLSWETATEQNAARFVVERSADGHSRWQDVGTVAATGNAQTMQQYSFMDTKPLASAYYRLRMIDQDNTFDYSPIIQLQRHSKDAALTVFPVPAKEEVHVSFYLAQAGPVAISVYDLTGKLVSQTTLNLASGLQQERLDVSSLASGVYLLNVEAGGQRYVERLIKQ